jgi:hypothetical protein
VSPRRDLSDEVRVRAPVPAPPFEPHVTVLNTGDAYVRLWAIDGDARGAALPRPPIGPGDSVEVTLTPKSRIEARSLLDDRAVPALTVTNPPGQAGEAYLNPAAAPSAAPPEPVPSPIPAVKGPLKTLDRRGRKPSPWEYVTIRDVPIFAEAGDIVFNTRICPRRRSVVITGVEIDFGGTPGVMAFAGEDVLDIAELTIAADRVTISEPLRFPSTHVTVRARVLEFKGAGKIDTTPLAWKAPAMSARTWVVPPAPAAAADKPSDPPPPPRVYEDDPFVYPGVVDGAGNVLRASAGADGADGGDAGTITLEIGELRIPLEAQPSLRLVAEGAQGQAAEPGGVSPRLFGDKTLAPITRDDIESAFADAFTIAKTADSWMWPAGALDLLPKRVTGGTQTGNVLFARILAADERWTSPSTDVFFFGGPDGPQHYLRDRKYPTRESADAFLTRQKYVERYRLGPVRDPDDIEKYLELVSDETPKEPKVFKGPDAYPGGRPGNGGNGRAITCTLSYRLDAISSVRRGEAGPATAAVAGGPCRNWPAFAVDVVINRDRTNGDVQPALVKRDVSPGPGDSTPARSGSDGERGSVTAGTGTSFGSDTDGVTRIFTLPGSASALGWADPAVVDAVLRCATDTFRMGYRTEAWRLLEPYAAEIVAGAPSALAPHAVQIEMLRHRLVANLDYAGHPPGYVPRLSALSSFYADSAVRVAALHMIRYANEAISAFDEVEEQKKVERQARAALAERVKAATRKIADAASTLQQASEKFEALAESVQKTDSEIKNLVDAIAVHAQHDVERQHIFAGVMHLLGGALQAIPVFQPYLGLGGSTLSTVGQIDFTKPVGAQMASTFKSVGETVDKFITDNKSLIAADFSGSSRTRAGEAGSDDLAKQIEDAEKELTPPERQASTARALLMIEEAKWKDKAADGTDSPELKTKAQQEAADAIAGWGKEIAAAKEELQRAHDRYVDPRLPRADSDAALAAHEAALAKLAALRKRRDDLDAKAKTADAAAADAANRLRKLKDLKTELEKKLADGESGRATRRTQVEETCQRLAGLGKGIADIGAGIAALTAPVGRDDPDVQRLIAQALAADDTTGTAYRELKQTFAKLLNDRQDAVAMLRRAQAGLFQGNTEIATSLDQLVALAQSRQHRFGLADARTRQHLDELKERGAEMMRQSVDSLLAALRYEFVMALPADLLDVTKIADRVAKTMAATKNATATDEEKARAFEQSVNAELWAALAAVAQWAMRNSGTFADRKKAPATKVVIERPTADPPQSERDARNKRILDELSAFGSSRVWAVEDLRVVTDYRWRGARIKDVTIKDIVLHPVPPRDGFYVELDVRHGGRAVVYERASDPDGGGSTEPAYFFFQTGDDDPRYWSGTAKVGGAAHTGPLLVTMSTPDREGVEELVTVLSKETDQNKPAEAPRETLKLVPYDPGLYAELILGARPDVIDKEPLPRIDRLTLEITYSSTMHV